MTVFHWTSIPSWIFMHLVGKYGILQEKFVHCTILRNSTGFAYSSGKYSIRNSASNVRTTWIYILLKNFHANLLLSSGFRRRVQCETARCLIPVSVYSTLHMYILEGRIFKHNQRLLTDILWANIALFFRKPHFFVGFLLVSFWGGILNETGVVFLIPCSNTCGDSEDCKSAG